MDWSAVLFLAAFIEGLINWLKADFRANVVNAIALLLGILTAIVVDFNLFAAVGIVEPLGWVGYLYKVLGWMFGGVVIARGSNYVHNILDKLARK